MKACQLVFAFASLLPDGEIPSEIVYFPEGEHKITATADGKPQTVTVKIPSTKGAEIAAALQADLEKRHSNNVRSWFDFEHKRGPLGALVNEPAFRSIPRIAAGSSGGFDFSEAKASTADDLAKWNHSGGIPPQMRVRAIQTLPPGQPARPHRLSRHGDASSVREWLTGAIRALDGQKPKFR